MYTKEQAQEKMQKFVDNRNEIWELNHSVFPDIIIYDELTDDYGFCWVFYWQVREIKDDYSNMIVGNGPILIEKDTLNMYMLGTGEEIADQIEEFKEDKNIFLHIEADEWGNFNAINR
jgi:hypothetical protein